MSLVAALADRTLPCWLEEIGHEAAGCGHYGAIYLSHKRLDRDVEDGGEFVCMPCASLFTQEVQDDHFAWCRELGLTTHPLPAW